MPTISSDTVDWESQWAQFAPGFKNGQAHIDLSYYGIKKTLLLQPGPGFGDLSHPTTSFWIASGFLREQRNSALSFIRELDFQLLDEKQKGEWLALKCKKYLTKSK